MPASSVTGVSGPGSSEGHGMKGPGNARNAFVPLVSPHVVVAGSVALVGGAATVSFPPLAHSYVQYVVMVTPIGASATPAWVISKADNADGNMISFNLGGTGTQRVEYAVIKAGVA